jgi:hypothetical protein
MGYIYIWDICLFEMILNEDLLLGFIVVKSLSIPFNSDTPRLMNGITLRIGSFASEPL